MTFIIVDENIGLQSLRMLWWDSQYRQDALPDACRQRYSNEGILKRSTTSKPHEQIMQSSEKTTAVLIELIYLVIWLSYNRSTLPQLPLWSKI